MEYQGHCSLEDKEAADFYNRKSLRTFCENEYIFCGTDIFKKQNGEIKRVEFSTIESKWFGTVKPRNMEQRAAVDMLKDDQTTIKLITGTWGSGKTLLLTCAALEAIEHDKFEKIVWIRNNVQVKDTDPLGALPGDAYDKTLPYLMPFADHCGGVEGVMRLIDEKKLEVIPLGFLRGRSIKNSIIISSEAENLTKEHIQLLIGRVDEGSNLWIDADVRQRDRVSFEKSKGIETMIERLMGEKLFGYVHLIKSERSETARLADKLN